MAEALGDSGDVVQHAFAATEADEPVVGQDDARAIPRIRAGFIIGGGAGDYSGG